jgi:hypothetical protein
MDFVQPCEPKTRIHVRKETIKNLLLFGLAIVPPQNKPVNAAKNFKLSWPLILSHPSVLGTKGHEYLENYGAL